MDQASISAYIVETFAGTCAVHPEANGGPAIAWGDTFFFYDPHHDIAPDHRFPFATIVTKDYGDFDRASNLDRPGVFRLNIGVGRDVYRSLFGARPSQHGWGDGETGHDFTALDRVMPHPVYAPQSWVCILNQSDVTFATQVRPLLAAAYELAVRRHANREASG